MYVCNVCTYVMSPCHVPCLQECDLPGHPWCSVACVKSRPCSTNPTALQRRGWPHRRGCSVGRCFDRLTSGGCPQKQKCVCVWDVWAARDGLGWDGCWMARWGFSQASEREGQDSFKHAPKYSSGLFWDGRAKTLTATSRGGR